MAEENSQIMQIPSQTPPQIQQLQAQHQHMQPPQQYQQAQQQAAQQMQQQQQQQHQQQQQSQQVQQQHQVHLQPQQQVQVQQQQAAQVQQQQQQQQQQQAQQQAQMQQQQQQQQAQQQQVQMQQSQQQAAQQQQQQQVQMQQQSQPQQTQQQQIAVAMSLANIDQASHINQMTNSIAINSAMNATQAQALGSNAVTVNNSGATAVHMTAVPQNAAQTAVFSQGSSQHQTMIHPTMSMAQSPLQQVQVIQQPLSAYNLHQLYTPQQPMVFPSNLTLQHAGIPSALQSIGPAQGLSLQLQAKTNLDPKTSGATAQTLQAVSAVNKGIALNTGNMMTSAGQVVGTGNKANFQAQQHQQVMAAASKQAAILHSQQQFQPGAANQIVISPLGVLSNQQSMFGPKTVTDTQKGKSYVMNQQQLQPKSPMFQGSIQQNAATGQVFNGNQLKQLTSSPQLITTSQATPASVFGQQLLGSLQALGAASLPQGISWATPNIQSGLLTAQNPIFISRQQSDMLISHPQTGAVHLPVGPSAPLPATSYASTPVPQPKMKQVRVRPGTSQTTSIATQTASITTAGAMHSTTPPYRAQSKPKVRTINNHLNTPMQPPPPQMTDTHTQTTGLPSAQTVPTVSSSMTSQQIQLPTSQSMPVMQQQQQQLQPQQMLQNTAQLRADAGNQTKPLVEVKSNAATQSKSVGVGMELKQHSPSITGKTQAKVAPTAKVVAEACVSTPVSCYPMSPAVSTSMSTMTVVTTIASSPLLSSLPSVQNPLPIQTGVNDVGIDASATQGTEDDDKQQQQLTEETKPSDESNTNLEPEIKLPETGHELRFPSQMAKERHPQKAIVKPHILTHVIDGYIIQEGPEPFPVSKSSLLTETTSPKPTPMEVANEATETPKVLMPEKKKKMHRVRGPVELAKCEFCGKLGAKSKFKRSKRFCSTSCAKRYNVCCSKRLGLLSPAAQENLLTAGKGPKKKKMLARARKSSRKTEGGRLAYNTSEWQEEDEEQKSQPQVEEETSGGDDEAKKISTEEETSESPSSNESLPPSDVIQPMKEDMDVDANESGSHATKPPTKWTVQDVFEFIKDLTGCSDYADEFRSQEIDGQALLLLKEDHLMSAIGMKLGPALKLIARIKSIKEELAHS